MAQGVGRQVMGVRRREVDTAEGEANCTPLTIEAVQRAVDRLGEGERKRCGGAAQISDVLWLDRSPVLFL